MVVQVKNVNDAFPNRLVIKYLSNGDRLAKSSRATVKAFECCFALSNVIIQGAILQTATALLASQVCLFFIASASQLSYLASCLVVSKSDAA